MNELQTLDVALIDVDDVNPRDHIDEDKLEQLAQSIGEHGVIQPVIVRREGDRFRLIAGQRRLLAAVRADVMEIPAVIRDVNGDARAIAVIENLQREQLNPIEEAKAFLAGIEGGLTPGELARTLSVSDQTIKQRLALLKQPVQVQELVAGGQLPLKAAAALEKLAAAGESVVAKTAALIAAPTGDRDGDVFPSDVANDPGWVLETVLEEIEKDGGDRPFLASERDIRHVDQLPWPKDVDSKALVAKAKKLPEHDAAWKPVRGKALELTTADLDAARAYGCLLEFDTNTGRSWGSTAWFNDPVWLADRLNQKLDAAIAKYEKKTKPKADTKTAGKATADPEVARKDRERKERAAAKAKQLAARERNITLGIALAKGLHAPAVTADGMRVVAELVLAYCAQDLGQAGVRFIDPDLQEVKTGKDGSTSNVTYEKRITECERVVRERVAKATTAEQILGALLQCVAAVQYADRTAAPESNRAGAVRGLGDGYYRNETLVELLDKIAEPILPSTADAA